MHFCAQKIVQNLGFRSPEMVHFLVSKNGSPKSAPVIFLIGVPILVPKNGILSGTQKWGHDFTFFAHKVAPKCSA